MDKNPFVHFLFCRQKSKNPIAQRLYAIYNTHALHAERSEGVFCPNVVEEQIAE